MSRPPKYKIVGTVLPSKHPYTKEEIDQKVDKALSLILDELILNGDLKIGE